MTGDVAHGDTADGNGQRTGVNESHDAGAAPGAVADPAELQRRNAALEAENAALRSRASGAPGEAPRHRGGRWVRRAAVSLFLVLGSLLAPISVLVIYLKTQVTDTSRYVSTVTPLASDPQIQAYVADEVTKEVMAQVDVRQYVSSALPVQAQALTGPITNAFEGFVRQTTLRVMQSDAFQQIWVTANRVGHKQLVKVVTGKGSAVDVAQNGAVTIDLSGLVANVKQELDKTGLDILDRVPTGKISGQVEIFQSKELYRTRRAMGWLETAGWLLPLLTLACFAGAILLSTNKRRGFIRVAGGLTAGAVILALTLRVGRAAYLDAVKKAIPVGAAASIYDTVLRSLTTSVRNGLLLSLIIFLSAWLAGPSRAAVATRHRWGRGVVWIGESFDATGWRALAAHGWVRRNRAPLRIALAVVLFLVALSWSHPTTMVLFWLAVIGVLGLGVIDVFGRGEASAPPPTPLRTGIPGADAA